MMMIDSNGQKKSLRAHQRWPCLRENIEEMQLDKNTQKNMKDDVGTNDKRHNDRPYIGT